MSIWIWWWVEWVEDGEGRYEMVAVISHLGKNTDHGHYVSHVKKNGLWVLFNDDKVIFSLIPYYSYSDSTLYNTMNTIIVIQHYITLWTLL